MRIRGGRVRRGRIGMTRGASTGPTYILPRSLLSAPLLPAPCSLLPRVRELPLPVRRTTTFHRRWLMEARITAQSQSFKLRERLEEAKVSHGQEIRADLPNVRVAVLAATEDAQLMFCNMGSIRVRVLVQPGDQGPLASQVTLQGLAVAFPGSYDLVNARVSANGGIHEIVDRETQVVPNVRRGLEGIAEVYLDNWPGRVG